MSRLLSLFWETTIVSGESIFDAQRAEKYERALILVKIYYFLLFYVSLQSFSPFYLVANWHQMSTAQEMFVPLWSATWINYLPWEVAINGVLLFFISTSFVAIWAGTRYRWVRIVTFVGLFLYLSLISSFGKIDHYLHAFTIVAFLFIFLPNHRAEPAAIHQRQFLQLFWGCQLWFLATYTSSGIFKFLGIASQFFSGQIHALHPESLARNVAKGNLNFGYRMFFDTFLVDSPGWVFSLLLVGGYLVELLALFVAFYPHLHRIWGMLLIGLHASVLLTVGPDFSLQVLIVGILLLFSPFGIRKEEWRRSWPGSALGVLRRSTQPIVVFFEPNDFSQRVVHSPHLRGRWPEYIRFVPQSSPEFAAFLERYPALSDVRTLVVAEQTSEHPIIRIKSEGVLWLIGQSYSRRRFCSLLLVLPPVITDIFYDWKARRSQPAKALAANVPVKFASSHQTKNAPPVR